MISGICEKRCHTRSMSKGVILRIHIPYMLAEQKHREQANSANGTRRSKVTEVESSMIETEATELKTRTSLLHCTLWACTTIRLKSVLASTNIHLQ